MKSSTFKHGKKPVKPKVTGKSRLNAYEVENADQLEWPVRLYKVTRTDGHQSKHSDRGDAKGLFFDLRRKHAASCRGYGFIVDVSKSKIAIPDAWEIPDCEQGGYTIELDSRFTAKASDPKDRTIVSGILREAIKAKFKNEFSDQLGPCWQDFGGFCQSPDLSRNDEFVFCRKFEPSIHFLRGNRLVVQILVRTISLDSRTFASYYEKGEVKKLARLIELKRANRITRDNKPVAVRVLCDNDDDRGMDFLALDLSEPDLVITESGLSRSEQQALAGKTISCDLYKRPPRSFPKASIRLILDSQITNEQHDKTILMPDDRDILHGEVANFIDEIDAFGQTALLSEKCIPCDDLSAFSVRPPKIRVADKERGETTIAAPSSVNADLLQDRVRSRSQRVRQHGFLQTRPMKPVVAAPKFFGDDRVVRMAEDMNVLQQRMGANIHFEHMLYSSVDDLKKQIDASEYDAALIVLPESSRSAHQADDTHEQLKKVIAVPSQCIHHDNALPAKWTNSERGSLSKSDSRVAQRVQQRYELCLSNLLVKHHWVPFAPAENFHYNVHVGIDVGGRHNNHAMLCVGYGFAKPQEDLVFFPEEIDANVQKMEPIPAEFLETSLIRVFSSLRKKLLESYGSADFDRVLFFRDGHLQGDGDAWNELDALQGLHDRFREKGWIADDAVWTGV